MKPYLISLALLAGLLPACQQETTRSTSENAEFSELYSAINQSTLLLLATSVGNASGEVSYDTYIALEDARDRARLISRDTSASAEEIDESLLVLKELIAKFSLEKENEIGDQENREEEGSDESNGSSNNEEENENQPTDHGEEDSTDREVEEPRDEENSSEPPAVVNGLSYAKIKDNAKYYAPVVPWADTYWPFTQVGHAERWLKSDYDQGEYKSF